MGRAIWPSKPGRQSMSSFVDPREEDMTSSFVIRQNIIRYLQLLQQETDLEKKRILLRLLGEEEAKRRVEPAAADLAKEGRIG